ncbi:TolC family protein [Lentisphaera profundi]|uniref:TolC family protein n=1 Tax=Lentisphaera profundi TaxID=1658616 RepID=A0ABY7VNV0_9BACT|nr:TolC family protein [Lentisphaera profundi]WDE95347.1 TolC family protein [Lentisphaera profundi]
MKKLLNIYIITLVLFAIVSCTHQGAAKPWSQQNYTPHFSPPSDQIELNQSKTVAISANISLNKLKQIAALSNAGLKAAYLKWQSELLKVYAAGTLPDPQVSFTHYIDEVETRVGPQKQAISVMQKFPWFGKLDLKKAMQTHSARAAKESYEAIKLSLFKEIELLYFDFYYLQESLRIAEENKGLLASFEPIARNLIKTGKSSADLLKVQVELGKIQDQISGLKLRWTPLKSRLNEILNQAQSEAIDLIAHLPERLPLNEEKLMWQVKNNPQVKAYDYKSEALKNKVILARKNSYPDFSLGFKYIRTDDSDMDVDDNGKDPIMATFGFTLPINQRKYRTLEASANKELDSVRWSQLQHQRSLERRLSIAFFELEDNERVLKLYRDTLIPKNKQSLTITQQAYRNGKASFLDLIDIQRQLLAFQLMEQRSLSNIFKQEALIRELTSPSLDDKELN